MKRVEIINGSLTCSKCGRTLPVSCFSKGNNANGYRSHCKECIRAAYQLKKDDIQQRRREYYERTKEHYLETCKQYRESHKNERKQYFSKYYIEHQDVFKERSKQAYENISEEGLEKRRQYIHKRRALKSFKKIRSEYEVRRKVAAAALVSDMTEEQWNTTMKEFGGCCAYCGTDKNITRDHIVPLSKGGGYTKTNIIPCCASCNSKKNNKEFREWYKAQPFYRADRLEKIERIMEGR